MTDMEEITVDGVPMEKDFHFDWEAHTNTPHQAMLVLLELNEMFVEQEELKAGGLGNEAFRNVKKEQTEPVDESSDLTRIEGGKGRSSSRLLSLLEADRPQQKQISKQRFLRGNLSQGTETKFVKFEKEADRSLSKILNLDSRTAGRLFVVQVNIFNNRLGCQVSVMSVQLVIDVSFPTMRQEQRVVGTSFVT